MALNVKNPGIELQGLIKHLPEALSTGKVTSSGRVTVKLLRLRRVFWHNFTHEFYTQVEKSFLKMSDGGTAHGVKWKPLKRTTIASRPKSQTGKRGLSAVISRRNKDKPKGKGLLTPKQTEIWRGIYASNFGRLAAIIGEGPAKAKAAQIAWGIIKSKYGGKTRIGTLGNRNVPILIRSGRLLKSLSPGGFSGNRYYPTKDQIYDLKGGKLQLGTRVPYAAKQNEARKLWGNESELISRAMNKAIKALTKSLKQP